MPNMASRFNTDLHLQSLKFSLVYKNLQTCKELQYDYGFLKFFVDA